jgi:NADH-quinone oxidoreductase subunit M
MDEFSNITVLTVTPLIGGVLLMLLGRFGETLVRKAAFLITALVFVMSVVIWRKFDATDGAIQLIERLPWIPALGVDYFVGIDGISLVMVMLGAVVVPMAVLVSRCGDERCGLYYGLMLWLQAGLFGVFTALNFFHWFLFWELSLIPAFFLVRLFGGVGRTGAATQFFVYTMVGSIALLIGFLGLYVATGTFDFIELAKLAKAGTIQQAIGDKLVWAGFSGNQIYLIIAVTVLLGFAVKVPMFPFHTWLPATYAEAPTPVTMLLTGAMSKLGVYGLLRLFLPIFPQAIEMMLTPLILLAIATIVLAAATAFVQTDIKRMFAYSSVNHLGYCLLGIFVATAVAENADFDRAALLNGVVLQSFNHGLTAAAIFGFIFFLEQRSGGTRGIGDFGGLRKVAPLFCALMGISLFASLGLPGLNGFVGEFLIFKGVFALSPWAAVLSLPGLLITAVFILTFLQKVFSGPLDPACADMADLSSDERQTMILPVVLMFALGVFPGFVINVINPTVLNLIEGLGGK